MEQKLKNRLLEQFGTERVLCDEAMNAHTTLHVGGKADYFVECADAKDLIFLRALCQEYQLPLLILGNGSNLLVKDGGIEGVVAHMGKLFSDIQVNGSHIYAQSGAMLSTLSRTAADAGLKGLAFAGGIPGSVGGAIYMNAGAYGGEIGQVLEYAEVLTDKGMERIENKDMHFAYRHTRAMDESMTVLGAMFALQKGDRDAIYAEMSDYNARRRDKQPLQYPSAGSFFKRPEGYFAGALIQECGLKGASVGGAQVSEKHAGFLINKGGATASDFLMLKDQIQQRVMEKFHVQMEPEVRIIGRDK